MIDLNKIKLSECLANRSNPAEIFSNLDKITQYKTTFVYDFGIIPIYILETNQDYLNYTTEENYAYLSSFVDYLFSNSNYTENELQILKIYLLSRIQRYSNSERDQTLENYFDWACKQTSDNPEIKYYIEEIKYRWLLTLTFNNRASDKPLISRLISELDEVEEEHNSFNPAVRVTSIQ